MKKQNVLISIIIILIFLLDRISKLFFLKTDLKFSFGILKFELSKNQFLYYINFPNWLLLPIIFITLLFIGIYLIKHYNKTLFLIFLGGLSNFIDRIIYGFVIDWITFSKIQFPIFNIADIMVITGLLLFFYKKFKF